MTEITDSLKAIVDITLEEEQTTLTILMELAQTNLWLAESSIFQEANDPLSMSSKKATDLIDELERDYSKLKQNLGTALKGLKREAHLFDASGELPKIIANEVREDVVKYATSVRGFIDKCAKYKQNFIEELRGDRGESI